MTIELVNTADTTWVNEAGDRTTVHGWILDENGQRIVPGLFLFSDAPRLPDIAPGDRMYLRVNIVTAMSKISLRGATRSWPSSVTWR